MVVQTLIYGSVCWFNKLMTTKSLENVQKRWQQENERKTNGSVVIGRVITSSYDWNVDFYSVQQ